LIGERRGSLTQHADTCVTFPVTTRYFATGGHSQIPGKTSGHTVRIAFRTRHPFAKAKAAGKHKGQAPTAGSDLAEVLALHSEGVGGTESSRRVCERAGKPRRRRAECGHSLRPEPRFTLRRKRVLQSLTSAALSTLIGFP